MLVAAVFCALLCLTAVQAHDGDRSFKVENGVFLKDGKSFQYASGAIHYFRVPHEYWDDRLKKLRASGANAVETYIEWSSHEPEPGVFRFEGDRDIVQFIKLAQANDLVVILRPGPFIDAERDFGGFPYWLLREAPEAKLRTQDPLHLQQVRKWFSVILPMMEPLLYHNGGPIIMVQVENEYGSFGCDHEYMEKMRDLNREFLGSEVVLFTVNMPADAAQKCGLTKDVYSTVDFGTGVDPEYAFAQQRKYDPTSPLVNIEFYPGWLDHWSEPHHTIASDLFTQRLDKILSMNASVNIYVFHGGSSFGFTAGSNGDENEFKVCPTSYDYDAPISEAGDTTDKYYAIKKVLEKYLPAPSLPVPPNSEKAAYGVVNMSCFTECIFDFTEASDVCKQSADPLTFEAIGQPTGFLYYEHVISQQHSDPAVLRIEGLKDRATVFVSGKWQGVLSREFKSYELPIQTRVGDKLQIFVENQGRLCFGTGINEYKGITGRVTLGPVSPLRDWKTCTVPLHDDAAVKAVRELKCRPDDSFPRPKFYRGTFNINSDKAADTFLRLDGWRKGVVFVNGFNLGRYWPIAGPQETLYVPKQRLNPGRNDLLILEEEAGPCVDPSTCYVEFVDKHVVNSTVPYNN